MIALRHLPAGKIDQGLQRQDMIIVRRQGDGAGAPLRGLGIVSVIKVDAPQKHRQHWIAGLQGHGLLQSRHGVVQTCHLCQRQGLMQRDASRARALAARQRKRLEGRVETALSSELLATCKESLGSEDTTNHKYCSGEWLGLVVRSERKTA